MATIGRFFELPPGSCFLFGPRGTGKTTWLRELLPAALHVNLLRPELQRELSARPESADVRALVSFRDDYPECEPLLLYRGEDRLVVNGVRCVPVAESLRALRPETDPSAGLRSGA